MKTYKEHLNEAPDVDKRNKSEYVRNRKDYVKQITRLKKAFNSNFPINPDKLGDDFYEGHVDALKWLANEIANIAEFVETNEILRVSDQL